MKRKWKNVSVLCLSAMLGCMLPMSTMRAAEGEAQDISAFEAVEDVKQEIGASEPAEDVTEEMDASEPTEDVTEEIGASELIEDVTEEIGASELIEDATEEIDASEPAEDATEEIDASEPAENVAEELAHDINADGKAQNLKTEKEDAELIYALAEESSAPVIEIQLEGVNRAQELEGKIEYNVYIGNHGQRLHIYVNQESKPAALCYYLDVITDGSDQSKSEEELAALWQTAEQTTHQEISLEKDGKYVLYVKAATADDRVSYARTNGIVVDATAPVITGIDNGGTYPAGTKFGVEDDNLDTVLVNEQQAVPSSVDGMYQVATSAGSTSCVIRAKDKVGNETVYSVTVENKEPDDDTTVIIENGIYSLRAGTAYRLDYGNWKIEGDDTVYRGGSTFYVKEDGSYHFRRSQ